MGAAQIFLSAGLLGLALGGLGPIATGTGAAWAQDDGGHEDGGHEDGGHEDGGGKGKGKGEGGQHGRPGEEPVVVPVTAVGDGTAVQSAPGAGRSVGNYFRAELGAARGSAGDANWLPPGFLGDDPQVFFDLDLDSGAMGALAVGREYGNGWRAELALNVFGSVDFAGPWSYTIPETEGPHADMEGSVRSLALMANGYRDFDLGGSATPFLTAGLGMARNTMGDWTRIAPEAEGGDRRSFAGASSTGLAWSVGAGVAFDVGPVLGSAPAKLELAWRYFDLGTAKGSSVRLDGGGGDGEGPGGEPVEGLNFDLTQQVFSVGLRIPF